MPVFAPATHRVVPEYVAVNDCRGVVASPLQHIQLTFQFLRGPRIVGIEKCDPISVRFTYTRVSCCLRPAIRASFHDAHVMIANAGRNSASFIGRAIIDEHYLERSRRLIKYGPDTRFDSGSPVVRRNDNWHTGRSTHR